MSLCVCRTRKCWLLKFTLKHHKKCEMGPKNKQLPKAKGQKNLPDLACPKTVEYFRDSGGVLCDPRPVIGIYFLHASLDGWKVLRWGLQPLDQSGPFICASDMFMFSSSRHIFSTTVIHHLSFPVTPLTLLKISSKVAQFGLYKSTMRDWIIAMLLRKKGDARGTWETLQFLSVMKTTHKQVKPFCKATLNNRKKCCGTTVCAVQHFISQQLYSKYI